MQYPAPSTLEQSLRALLGHLDQAIAAGKRIAEVIAIIVQIGGGRS